MLMELERQQVVEAGRLMYDRGLCQMCGGNISIRDPKAGLVAIKPSGGAYVHLRPEDIIIVDMEGKVVEGSREPSIETHMHLGIYKARPEVLAVVHSHPLHAVAWSLRHSYLPSVICAQYMLNGAVKVAPYEDAGSLALAGSAVKAIGQDGWACILQAHGVIAGSQYGVFHALEMNMVVEDACRIAMLCGPGEGYFTIDAQLGEAGGYDGLERLRRFAAES